jgi:hypothetical protein
LAGCSRSTRNVAAGSPDLLALLEIASTRLSLNPHGQIAVFIHQRLHQQPIDGRQHRHNFPQARLGGQGQLNRESALDRLAPPPRVLNGSFLVPQGCPADRRPIRLAALDLLLPIIEPGQHFSELLQFVAQGLDKLL